MMKRTVFILGVTMSAMAVTSLAAFAAAEGRGEHRMTFEEIDVDGDGMITQLEMESVATNRFAKSDADGDGFLTQSELEAAAQEKITKRVEKMIERMDADGDGQLALDEMKSRHDPAKMFDRVDADGDGAISKAEFDDAKKKHKKHKKHKKDKNDAAQD